MTKEVDKKQCSIDLLHNKIKHLNKIDDTNTLELKKIEEPLELKEAVEELVKAIYHYHSELADNIIKERDNTCFDFRRENSRQQSKAKDYLSLGSLVSLIISEEEILKHCHLKVDRTIKRIEEGYYETNNKI